MGEEEHDGSPVAVRGPELAADPASRPHRLGRVRAAVDRHDYLGVAEGLGTPGHLFGMELSTPMLFKRTRSPAT